MGEKEPAKNQGTIDGKVLTDLIEFICRNHKAMVQQEVAEWRKAHPESGPEQLANLIIFSNILTMAKVSEWNMSENRQARLLLEFGLTEESLQLLLRETLSILFISEVYPRRLEGLSMGGFITLLLFAELSGFSSGLYDITSLDGIKTYLSKCDQTMISREFLLLFRRRFGWRHLNNRLPSAPLFAASNFIFLRNVGLSAKYLLNDGTISEAEMANFKKFREDVLMVYLKALVSLALADGQLAAEERDFINAFCEAHGMTAPTVNFQEFSETILAEIKALGLSGEQKEFFLSCLSDLTSVDQKSSAIENRFLEMLKEAI